MTMSPPSIEREERQSADDAPAEGVRVYRGRSLAELLPQIRSELGPDAVVLRQREGRAGGIGGFFAQRYFEVEATRRTAMVDVLDEDEAPAAPLGEYEWVVGETGGYARPLGGRHGGPAISAQLAADRADADGATGASVPAASAIAVAFEAIVPAALAPEEERSFATMLAAADEPAAPPPEAPEIEQVAAAVVVEEGVAPAAIVPSDAESEVLAELLARGLSTTLATRLIAQARAHQLPFAPAGELRDAVRDALARALPDYHGLPIDGALVALTGTSGSGKTHVAAALATAYHTHSPLTTRALTTGDRHDLTTLTELCAPHGIPVSTAEPHTTTPRHGHLIVLDTPALTPADPTAIATLATTLHHHTTDAILLAIPATHSLIAAQQLLTALTPLTPTAIVITHTDETDQLGAAVETAITTTTPLAYLHQPHNTTNPLRPAHPTHIATTLLP